MVSVLTNNPPNPHRSNTVPQITSSTRLSASGIHQQNAAPRTLDDRVEQLLAKARLPMEDAEVPEVAELLEKMLDPHYPIALRTRRRCFRGLVKLCGEYGILPSSYIIPESMVEKLGEGPISTGGFSDVWPGMYEDDKCVAIKVIRCYETDNAQNIRKNFCREVITWRRLSHPNILELIGVTMNGRECAMVSPWMDCGNILDYVRDEPQANPFKLLVDAARGLEYLHSVELAHGDLKGANILVSEEGHACLTDVGLTRVASDISSNTLTTTTSMNDGHTLRWSAPELLDPERFGFKRGGPTKKSDIYSMAMTIYEVLTDKVPFWEHKELTVMLLIGQGVRPQKPLFLITRGYTEELWEMTISCWSERPSERPNVDVILEAMKAGAEEWKPQNGSPQDDWSPTLCTVSDSHALPKLEDDRSTTDASISPPRSPVTKTPVPATTLFAPTPSPPTSSPWITEYEVLPEHTPVISHEEKLPSVLKVPYQGGDFVVASRKEEVEPVFARPPIQTRSKSIHDFSSEEGAWFESVGSSGEEEPISNPATTGKKNAKTASIGSSEKEELERPVPVSRIPATSEKEGIRHTPASLPEIQYRLSSTVPRTGKIEETVPVQPNPAPLKEQERVYLASTTLSEQALPGITPAKSSERNKILSAKESSLPTSPELVDRHNTTNVPGPTNPGHEYTLFAGGLPTPRRRFPDA